MKKFVLAIVIFVAVTGVLPLTPVYAVSEGDYDYTLDVSKRERKPIAKSYIYEKSIVSFGEGIGRLDGVQDFHMDSDDNLYIADTGNNRIIKTNINGELLGVFTGQEDRPFNKPEGVFSDSHGSIFVADTGNNRVVHLGEEGGFIEEFTKPSSDLLEPSFVYNPRKVAVSPTGYIYSIKYQMLMQVDAFNRFRGYVGSTRVGFNFTRVLLHMFASKEQKSKLAKVEPSPYINFTMTKDGYIYATTLDYKGGQIKKLNSIGENIFPADFLWEFSYNSMNGWWDHPVFEDIAVDKDGIVSVIDRVSAKIYQYDQEGNLLTVFGGRGTRKGSLSLPKCIEVDSKGNVYIYDAKNSILIYKPTRFITTVHQAINSYMGGEYEKAMTEWKNVLEMCETYDLAHVGLGKTYFKKKIYKKAADEFFKALDKDNYTRAFAKYRYEYIREKFSWVVFGMISFVIIFILMVRAIYRLSFVCEEVYIKIRKEV